MKYVIILIFSGVVTACLPALTENSGSGTGAAPVYADVCIEWITDDYETECSSWTRRVVGYR